jgi:hypothetical protein
MLDAPMVRMIDWMDVQPVSSTSPMTISFTRREKTTRCGVSSRKSQVRNLTT